MHKLGWDELEGSGPMVDGAVGGGLRTVLTPLHSTPILTSSPPSGPLSYLTESAVRLSRLRRFSELSGSPSTSATLCLCAMSRPCRRGGRQHGGCEGSH